MENKERQGQKNYLKKIMAKNLPNLGKETDIQVQEAQRVPNKTNLRDTNQDTLYLKW